MRAPSPSNPWIRTLATSARLLLALTVSALVAGCGADEASVESEAAVAPPEVATGPQIVTEEIVYAHDGVALNGYIAYDAAIAGERPGVLVVHEWWGHNDYARQRAEQLAEMGYTGMAIDMYGDGKLATHPEDAQKFMTEVVSQLDTAVARFDAGRQQLEAHPTTDPSRTAAIGYCFGGAVVLHMARSGADLAGVASFHGDLSTETPAAAGDIQTRILVLHGADDPFIPAEQLEAFHAEMETAGADMTFHSYPGAVHSFTNPAATAVGVEFELPLAYNAEADQASWATLDEFLASIFGT